MGEVHQDERNSTGKWTRQEIHTRKVTENKIKKVELLYVINEIMVTFKLNKLIQVHLSFRFFLTQKGQKVKVMDQVANSHQIFTPKEGMIVYLFFATFNHPRQPVSQKSCFMFHGILQRSS